jgi:APA family basic amino acid/polyamine antiporter
MSGWRSRLQALAVNFWQVQGLTKSVDLLRAEAAANQAAELDEGFTGLKRSLGAIDLTLFGVGCIIGSGIYVLTGLVAATSTGPALVISMLIAALASALCGLCYAELAAMIPVSGSAYSYAYAALGEIWAWLIGWDLILEYGLAVACVAVGWSGSCCCWFVGLFV